MTKPPEHLQKKIDELAQNYNFESDKFVFLKGASAMHSLMLEELKLLVEAFDKLITKENESIHLGITGQLVFEAEQALVHYRENIEGK